MPIVIEVASTEKLPEKGKRSPAARPGKKKKPRRGKTGPAVGSLRRKKPITDFHKRKEARKKDKGKPNTPGELMREIKGGMTLGNIRSKKVLKGDYDIGKKLRYQRRGKSTGGDVKMRGGGVAKRGLGIAKRGGGIAERGLGIAKRGGGIAKRGMGIAK